MNLKDILEALGKDGFRESGKVFLTARNKENWQRVKNDGFYEEMLRTITDDGEKYLGSSIKSLPFSSYRIYDITGSRKEYEEQYFERRGRLNTFAILALTYEDEKYIQALQDVIWAICDEYTWCLPAHLGGLSLSVVENVNKGEARGGIYKGSIREHKSTVDLFAAETGFALAEIVSLLEDRIEPLVVYRARKEVTARILEPYMELNNCFGWETVTNNWSAVCAGSVGAAAMYMIEEPSVLAPLLLRVCNTIECFLEGYGEDGVCTEGLGYWNYGFGFFTYFAELLREKTDGEIDLFQNEKVKNIAMFQQKCFLSEDQIITFSDSFPPGRYNAALTHYLKSRFNEVEIPDNKYQSKINGDGCHRWAPVIRSFMWTNSNFEGGKLKDAGYYLKDAQWLVSRKLKEDMTICFAAKAGNNAEPHNQNDVGSFILHVNGENLLIDIGSGEYTKQYFGPERYTILCNGSQGHSVPVVEAGFQKAGKDYKAEIFEAKVSDEKDSFVMDISKAYGNNNLIALVRNFTFDKGERSGLTLKDSFSFINKPLSIVERFMSFRKPQLIQAGRVLIQGDKSKVEVIFDPDKLDCIINRETHISHGAVPVDVYGIDLICKNPGIEEKVEVLFQV